MKDKKQRFTLKNSMRILLFCCMFICCLASGCKKKEVLYTVQDEQAAAEKSDTTAKSDTEAAKSEATAAESETEAINSKAASEGNDKIMVHVCGEVHAPGVYELDDGSRLYEAINAAGGCTEAADKMLLNEASALSDGQQVVVYSKEEAALIREGQKPNQNTFGAAGDAAGSSTQADGTAAGDIMADSRVNINTASIEELTTLNGVGTSRAEAIISYRDAKGGFRSIEEIMNIDGIKEKSFEKIKDKITVG